MIFRERPLPPHLRAARLAELPGVHRAFRWLHLQEQRIRGWQREVVSIPAPPFAEEQRAAWMMERMEEIGLSNVHRDDVGNTLGLLRSDDSTSPLLLLSAHLDTVFPSETPLVIREEDDVLHAPGAADNGAGLAGLLAVAAALRAGDLLPDTNILFAANVGEEAEGDLRGMRHLFTASPFAKRIGRAIALEGAGLGTVVTRALGSRRFRVVVTGPGGHAWTDSRVPNPLVTLANAIAQLTVEPLPAHPRTTLNIGQVHGGTSVTAVPQEAMASFDLRSTDSGHLLALEVRLYRAIEDAVLHTQRGAPGGLTANIEVIGSRPAGALLPGSRLMESVQAVDRHLNLRTEERLGSTDANIPLSMGREAIAIGAGGTAGGIHTTHEWHDARSRDLALKRILLIVMDLCTTWTDTRSDA